MCDALDAYTAESRRAVKWMMAANMAIPAVSANPRYAIILKQNLKISNAQVVQISITSTYYLTCFFSENFIYEVIFFFTQMSMNFRFFFFKYNFPMIGR